MADKLYKVNEPIELGYQAPNKESGLTGPNAPIAEIYLPNKMKDSSFPDVELVEVGSSGTYRGSFTPDQEGTWQVVIHKADGDGQVTKSFSVGAVNIQDIYTDAAKAADLTNGINSINTNVDDVETNIRGADNDTLKTLSDQIDAVDSKVSTLDTPPMAF